MLLCSSPLAGRENDLRKAHDRSGPSWTALKRGTFRSWVSLCRSYDRSDPYRLQHSDCVRNMGCLSPQCCSYSDPETKASLKRCPRKPTTAPHFALRKEW